MFKLFFHKKRPPKIAVNCKTQKEALLFFEEMHKKKQNMAWGKEFKRGYTVVC